MKCELYVKKAVRKRNDYKKDVRVGRGGEWW